MNRKRVKELYAVLKSANEELEEIRKKCPHKKWKVGNYMWAPGHINNGAICNLCDKYLGEAKTFAVWLFILNDDYDVYNICLTGKSKKFEKITADNYPDEEKLFTRKEFVKELEKRNVFVPDELKKYHGSWIVRID